ncbi:MAG: hypothetical protein P1U56_01125 [Saprospiraceae bacterium]|nr:hypothetical protein [Saprospiraceae bacterium]
MTTVNEKAAIEQVEIDNRLYYKISNSDSMRPFFMSIVSDSNHWMFISSNGGLTAGRKNSEFSLFPYYTDDKITESSEITGSKTILKVSRNGKTQTWEPFSIRNRGKYKVSSNLYKNSFGNRVLFEEVNHDLDITFRYEWCSSNIYGFVRRSKIINTSDKPASISMLDGIQNIMPYGVPSDTQSSTSNLVDAYKRSELHKDSGLGIFALSAIIVDKAEPSEALKANVAWSIGLDNSEYLLSSLQLDAFRSLEEVQEEVDVKGEKGAYFLKNTYELSSLEEKEWLIVANVNQTQSKVAELIQMLGAEKDIVQHIHDDIERGTKNLIALNASADGIHCTADELRDSRHFANVLFNNMRGGIFDNGYMIELWDFSTYLSNANREVFENNKAFLDALPSSFSLHTLRTALKDSSDIDFIRLATEYLPLKFSRRHGDPSRPWNKFSINMINENDGSKILDYEGNWRDIFQNWEAMVHSFPDFIDGMIFRFLNASTFDGYNPYRITKGGFDWETIEPDDPWSYIGYWGDHQIIYLQKFLEFIEKHKPGKLAEYFDQDAFVYANVPYKIKSYNEIVENPKDTILFDEEADHQIRERQSKMGADGTLLHDENGQIHRVNFIEKILATVLAKLSNYVPEGGIWMNTQRPEWNDANNALVGNGVSMVTLYYLRRFLSFFYTALENSDLEEIKVSNEVMDFYKQIRKTFEEHEALLEKEISNEERKIMVDELGSAASDFRNHVYQQSFWGKKRTISMDGLKRFIKSAIGHMDHTIHSNKRSDNLFHAYNLLTFDVDEVKISYLSEMLEGQVAVLSSGVMTAEESLEILDGLKKSSLFRPDQYSYILYPNKQLLGFLEKNIIPNELVESSALFQQLLKDGNNQIIEKDVFGKTHFNGNFRNVQDLNTALSAFENSQYKELVEQEKEVLGDIFETVFNHKAFTGRSGTFFGYEGLGSIYWHMVSKLLLAVQETCLRAIEDKVDPSISGRLLEHFYEINEGIGVHKSPSLYGAFPTDPYSHTPANKGAQQPGMTGQVKEDILSRYGELGVFVENGSLYFNPCLLRKEEFLVNDKVFNYLDVSGNKQRIQLSSGELAFTYCQVPIVYKISDEEKLIVVNSDNSTDTIHSLRLNMVQSIQVFKRTNELKQIEVFINSSRLK